MTKRRDPLSFGGAVLETVNLIGWREACRLVGRADRTVRHWTETDKKGSPTLEQALLLDCAHIAAGGTGAPILESYIAQIEVAMSTLLACRMSLSEDIATATREAADAFAHSIMVAQPGASPAAILKAIVETEEACGALTRLLSRLRKFLPNCWAGNERAGITT